MSSSSSSSSAVAAVDEERYSRQLYSLGRSGQVRLGAARVLVVGLSGVGAEVAKNLALMGVGELLLCDETPTAWTDLSSNCYLSAAHAAAAAPRGAAVAPALAALNESVGVSARREGVGGAARGAARGAASAAALGTARARTRASRQCSVKKQGARAAGAGGAWLKRRHTASGAWGSSTRMPATHQLGFGRR